MLLPLALALADTLVVYRLNAWEAFGSFNVVVVAIAIIFGVSSLLAAFLVAALPRWAIVLLMLGGIGIGVLADVIMDSIFFSADRTLFPIEMAFLWGLTIAPIALGCLVGRALHARRRPP